MKVNDVVTYHNPSDAKSPKSLTGKILEISTYEDKLVARVHFTDGQVFSVLIKDLTLVNE